MVMEAFKKANTIASLTLFQEQLLKRTCSDVVSEIIPNLLNERIFKIYNEIHKNSKFTIISVLYTNPVKGREYLFKCFQKLKENGILFKYIIIGEGIEQMTMECELLGIKSEGEFYYNLNKEELTSLFNSSHLYCCSSIYETFGLAAREAMLCGLPVVTTDNQGVVDCISKDTGLIVPIQDSNALAEAIVLVKNNYDNYDPFLIRNKIIEQCGTEVFNKKIMKFYRIDFEPGI